MRKLWHTKLSSRIKKLKSFVFSATALTIITMAHSFVSTHNTTVDEKYTVLKNDLRNLSYDERSAYLLCHSDVKKKYPQLYMKTLYNTHESIMNDFHRLINFGFDLHDDGFITTSAFAQLSAYEQHIDYLYSSGFDMCDTQLKNSDEILAARTHLIDEMTESQDKFLWKIADV